MAVYLTERDMIRLDDAIRDRMDDNKLLDRILLSAEGSHTGKIDFCINSNEVAVLKSAAATKHNRNGTFTKLLKLTKNG